MKTTVASKPLRTEPYRRVHKAPAPDTQQQVPQSPAAAQMVDPAKFRSKRLCCNLEVPATHLSHVDADTDKRLFRVQGDGTVKLMTPWSMPKKEDTQRIVKERTPPVADLASFFRQESDGETPSPIALPVLSRAASLIGLRAELWNSQGCSTGARREKKSRGRNKARGPNGRVLVVSD